MQRNVNVTNPFVSGDGSFPFPGAAFLVRLNANKRKPKSNKPVAPIAITDGTGTNDSNTKSGRHQETCCCVHHQERSRTGRTTGPSAPTSSSSTLRQRPLKSKRQQATPAACCTPQAAEFDGCWPIGGRYGISNSNPTDYTAAGTNGEGG